MLFYTLLQHSNSAAVAKGYYGEAAQAITSELKIFENYGPNPKSAICNPQ
jgi:hypothetical protein